MEESAHAPGWRTSPPQSASENPGQLTSQPQQLSRRRLMLASAAAITSLSLGLWSRAPAYGRQARRLKVVVFPGGFNLPIWVAQEKGFLAREDLEVELAYTPGSVYQITKLAEGEFDIAHTAMDNVVAYVEGQGEVALTPQPDLIAFMGCDNGFLRLVVQPSITRYEDLKGKELSVDALTTGYAFVLRKMLERNGLVASDYKLVPVGGVLQRWEALKAGKHAGTLLVTPFELMAQRVGLRVLGNAIDVLGRYQGVVGATRRRWAEAHVEEVVSYIKAYVSALTWLYNPANRDEAVDLLVRYAKMERALAQETYRVLIDPVFGFSPSAVLDIEGVRTVLALRSQYAEPRKVLGDPGKYVDLTYYNKALHRSP